MCLVSSTLWAASDIPMENKHSSWTQISRGLSIKLVRSAFLWGDLDLDYYYSDPWLFRPIKRGSHFKCGHMALYLIFYFHCISTVFILSTDVSIIDTSVERMNSFWSQIHQLHWCCMICVILDLWFWFSCACFQLATLTFTERRKCLVWESNTVEIEN